MYFRRYAEVKIVAFMFWTISIYLEMPIWTASSDGMVRLRMFT